MAKNYRGKALRKLPFHGRGECPMCKRTGVKILHEMKVNEQTVKVCKYCTKVDPARLAQ